MSHASDIAGYTYKADIYCRYCIIDALPTGPGQQFDGWALAAGVSMTTEANLSEIAYAFQIDRQDESSFDNSEFPKVIFDSQAAETDSCCVCQQPICVESGPGTFN